MSGKNNLQTKTNKEKMIAGEFYNPIDKRLLFDRTRARCLADRFNKTHAWNILRRTHLIKNCSRTAEKEHFLNRQSELNTDTTLHSAKTST